MNRLRQIYLLDPQQLPPETIAVTFAKTSRSPLSFREIAEELSDEKSSEFHEKWVVGYGHASVAEHAVLHIAIENISRLAVEALESNRLASYTEKSTRYQKWGAEDYYLPLEFSKPALRKLYEETCRMLFSVYQESLPMLKKVVEQENPRQENESEAAWERRIRTEYVDECRFLLPAAALANVGMTINARELEHAIIKMLSHPLDEVRQMGNDIKTAALQETPTLIKYADENDYQLNTRQHLRQIAGRFSPPGDTQEWCQLIDWDPENETRILAAALFSQGNFSYTQANQIVIDLAESERLTLVKAMLGHLTRHDIPLRELEYSTFTFDVIIDQGAYNELKRHRMMTQTPQALTPYLGYAVPRRLGDCIQDRFDAAMRQVTQAYEILAETAPDAGSYIIPNACNRRVLLTMNLRSAFHFLALRSASNAHFSIRRLARRMAEQIEKCCPILAGYINLLPGETWQQIEAQFFSRCR